MKRLFLPFLALIATGVLAGCDSGPSTPIAPDQPMPDTSKMTPDELMKLKQGSNETDRKANSPMNPSVGRAGDTPPDRQLPGGG